MSERPLVELQVEGAVALIHLDDPDRRNALSPELAGDLIDACATARDDPAVRCVIVTGRGTAFSAGGDVHRMADGRSARPVAELANEPFSEASYTLHARRTIKAFLALEKPIIAALNGPAMGWGTDIALASDIRLATPTVKMGESFVRLGAVSGTGAIFLLPRIIGLGRAAELLLTGRTIDGAEAERIGLVNHLVEPEDLLPRAREIAEEVAQAAPIAVQLTKRALYSPSNWAGSIDQALTEVMHYNQICLNSEDHQEAARALLEKRPPEFRRA
jgi:enoyl-CoA hydratase/carnithine racemase